MKLNWNQIIKWSQFIGTITAIGGLIFTIIQSDKNDNVLQSQINHLDTIAQQSILQTEKMQEQVVILEEERNFLYEQFEIKSKRRKLEIKPKLSLNITNFIGGNYVFGYLSNSGKQAEIIRVVPGEENNVKIEIPFNYIGESKKKKVFLKIKNHTNPIIDFRIFFKDIEGSTYSKRFRITEKEKIFYREPPKIVG